MTAKIIRPQEGAQTAFLSCDADIAIYGGSAGGGKTFSLLLHSLSMALQGGNPVILRKTFPEIIQEGGLWDYANELYLPLGAISKQSTEMTFNFPKTGGSVTFGHMQHEKDKYKWQGSQIGCVAFDELTHFSRTQFFYMLSRNRDPKGIIHPHIRATCNPDPDSWVADFLSWWIDEEGNPIKERSGVFRYFVTVNDEFQWANNKQELIDKYGPDMEPKSVTFIPATIQDNKILLEKDPSYVASLKALDQVEKQRLLLGNWKAKRIGKLFKNPQFGWDDRHDTIGWVDTAFGGTNNSSFVLGCEYEGIYYISGWSWRQSVTELFNDFIRYTKQYHCGTITFESNADKGESAKQFRKLYPSVSEHHERENKHNKIMIYAVYNWANVRINPDCYKTEEGKRFINNLLAYEENKEPDDEADATASLIRKLMKAKDPGFVNLGSLG